MAMTSWDYYMCVIHLTVLASDIKNYSVVFGKFNAAVKCYVKRPPLRQTWLINSWLKYCVKNRMVSASQRTLLII